MNNNKLATVLFCLLYAVVNVSGSAIIKWKLKSQPLIKFEDWLRFLFSVPVIIAFVLIFLSALVMFKALSLGSLSFTVPVATGINFIITITFGYFIFKDTLNWWSAFGFSLIIIGIVVLSLNNSHNET